MAEKEDFSQISYVLGIMSIVFGFISPVAGFILGFIGLRLSKKQISNLSKTAKKLNIWGIIISIVVFLIIVTVSLLESFGYLPKIPGVQ
jgi:uncharacterized protein YybS (DUF2232 family)